MPKKSLNDQIVEAKELAKNLGFIATGNVNGKSGPYRMFEVFNGNRTGWIALTALRKGVSPFTRLTNDELLTEATELAKKFKGVPTGKIISQSGSKKIEIKKDEKYRWITIGHLREGNNPFLIPTLEEMKKEVAIYAQKLGLTFDGIHNGEKGNKSKFQLQLNERKAWITLAGLRNGNNPFYITPIEDQLKLVSELAVKISAATTGNYKRFHKANTLKFELRKNEMTRWTTLHHLKVGNDPFSVKTIEQQILEAKELAHKYGLVATGKQKKTRGTDRRFQVTDGKKFNWLSLYHLRIRVNPFRIASAEEQYKEAETLASHLGLFLTGNTEQAKYKHRKFEISNGTSNEWTTLGQLRQGQNPFNPGGFDTSRKGYFYIIKVLSSTGDFINIGISNNYKKRLSSHKTNLMKNGMSYEIHAVYEFSNGKDALDFETNVKRRMQKIDLGVDGFRTETTSWKELPMIEDLINNTDELSRKVV